MRSALIAATLALCVADRNGEIGAALALGWPAATDAAARRHARLFVVATVSSSPRPRCSLFPPCPPFSLFLQAFRRRRFRRGSGSFGFGAGSSGCPLLLSAQLRYFCTRRQPRPPSSPAASFTARVRRATLGCARCWGGAARSGSSLLCPIRSRRLPRSPQNLSALAMRCALCCRREPLRSSPRYQCASLVESSCYFTLLAFSSSTARATSTRLLPGTTAATLRARPAYTRLCASRAATSPPCAPQAAL